MGLFGKLILATVAFGAGYYVGKDKCFPEYKQGLVFASRSNSPIIGPADVALDYVTARNFEGVVVTHVDTGEKGFLARNDWSGKLSYFGLEAELTPPVQTMSLYHPQGVQLSQPSTSTGIVSKILQQADQLVHRYIP